MLNFIEINATYLPGKYLNFLKVNCNRKRIPLINFKFHSCASMILVGVSHVLFSIRIFRVSYFIIKQVTFLIEVQKKEAESTLLHFREKGRKKLFSKRTVKFILMAVEPTILKFRNCELHIHNVIKKTLKRRKKTTIHSKKVKQRRKKEWHSSKQEYLLCVCV